MGDYTKFPPPVAIDTWSAQDQIFATADNGSVEFLGAQRKRVLADQAATREDGGGPREDMHVLTAVVLRHENVLKNMLAQITAMVAQHQRFNDRLHRLEEPPAE